jgi:hypothetical protein
VERLWASPVRRPIRPSLTLAGCWWAAHAAAASWDLPCRRTPPVHTCRCHYPGGALYPSFIPSSDCGLPRVVGGSAPALLLSRPAQHSLALRPACLRNRFHDPGRWMPVIASGKKRAKEARSETCGASGSSVVQSRRSFAFPVRCFQVGRASCPQLNTALWFLSSLHSVYRRTSQSLEARPTAAQTRRVSRPLQGEFNSPPSNSGSQSV